MKNHNIFPQLAKYREEQEKKEGKEKKTTKWVQENFLFLILQSKQQQKTPHTRHVHMQTHLPAQHIIRLANLLLIPSLLHSPHGIHGQSVCFGPGGCLSVRSYRTSGSALLRQQETQH